MLDYEDNAILGDPVEVTDHSGGHKKERVTCEDIANIDENEANELLGIGCGLEKWGQTNHGQFFLQDIISQLIVDAITY